MKAAMDVALNPSPVISFDHKRDAYGFAVRPQHLQRYREYANIYKEEEEERSDRWKDFLERRAESPHLPDKLSENDIKLKIVSPKFKADSISENDDSTCEKPNSDSSSEEKKEVLSAPEIKVHRVQLWTEIRHSLCIIEDMMSARVKKKVNSIKNEGDSGTRKHLPTIEEARPGKGASEEDSDEEFYDLERLESDPNLDIPSTDSISVPTMGAAGDSAVPDLQPPWTEELECLVRGGVPMALRGELWQAFVGVRTRRMEKYYQELLAPDAISGNNLESKSAELDDNSHESSTDVTEKWKGQIEKDLPRTFPGHPALDEDGRNALRRLLTAYARHNPSVGYCQAMNFFAGLLLLLMPEENAFWTLMGILDDYFDGYYSEEMLESQVDQLVLEELVREKFPKLVNHLDYLGVQVAWVTGPWFLSIFMNMLPWESVLRVWDVLLYEGNRVMLFRTALALMELYGPALVTTKDAGDAVTLLQSLAGSTFDSSQLVLTACMGYQNVHETRLQELRNKHRPAVRAALEERLKGVRVWRDSKGLASKLYSFNHDHDSMMVGTDKSEELAARTNGDTTYLDLSLNGDVEIDSTKDLQEQVVWLKVELCKLLEEKRSAELRAEELETALMEMVKQDNRRQLSARVEQLEREVTELRQTLADKQEQENAMLQILMRVEHEQRVTEDARRFAEQDAAAQRIAAQVLQEKYEEATTALAEMEKRVVMAESMLEATLQYQSGQNKGQPSPRSTQQDSSPVRSNQDSQDSSTRKISLLSRPFGLGWRDRNKGKPNTVEEANSSKSLNEEHFLSSPPDEKSSRDGHGSNTWQEESNDHQKDEKANDS
ncbi:TBC1 domain family member 8B-like isoform X1 [Olea europaea var. sylvestris]|uniref:TBC1 domain family member 8B-like isoform X1 n=1 Tax=Olea europaea var. sylvestris TaxID=158386 RepID=UPI000C1D7268|nr:TBC1 domain family member 8B-like isoform X1 [Olea europaea var. sylvestris]